MPPGVIAMALILLAMRANATSFAFARYDDNVRDLADPARRTTLYDDLKYIPLGSDEANYLSLGGDLRERLVGFEHASLGLKGNARNWDEQHRLLLFADLHWGNARAFLQLGNHVVWGDAPSRKPFDTDRGDIQQAFVDYTFTIGDGRLTLRGGRAEMSFGDALLIGMRDGPNIRRDWDGVRSFYVLPGWRIDAFAVRPVTDKIGYFDDVSTRGEALWGVYATGHPEWLHGYALDLFSLGNVMPDVKIEAGPGKEHTLTTGLRWYGHAGSFDSDIDLIGQVGRLRSKRVRAFGVHGDAGWTFQAHDWQPRVGARIDVLSGTRHPDGNTVGTFNALYPKNAYFTEASIEAPANLMLGGVSFGVRPAKALSVSYEVDGLWRYSTRDAFYAAGLVPLIKGNTSRERYIGIEQQIKSTLMVNRYLSLTAALAHLSAKTFVVRAGGRSENYASIWASLRF